MVSGIAVVGDFDGVFRFAGLGRRSRKLQFAFFQLEAHGARTLVGKLRDAGDGLAEFRRLGTVTLGCCPWAARLRSWGIGR